MKVFVDQEHNDSITLVNPGHKMASNDVYRSKPEFITKKALLRTGEEGFELAG